MGFNEQEIRQIAEVRGQQEVLVEVDGKPRWFLVDALPCTLLDVMQCFGDYWEYRDGYYDVTDADGTAYDPNIDETYTADWSQKGLKVTRNEKPFPPLGTDVRED